jgi:hypothetical protein
LIAPACHSSARWLTIYADGCRPEAHSCFPFENPVSDRAPRL